MAQEQEPEPGPEGWIRSPERTERIIEGTRAVVYADDDRSEFIDPDDLDDALREAGVKTVEWADGETGYDECETDVSIRAAHLAVDLRRDPAEFLHPVERRPDRDTADS
ncbi:MAG TPA: hypothetical protein VFJ06_14235 [Halococcus sp.]|nr:hypothetical protein [Halococcus sp.]